jgi:hypothetical protein
MLLAEKCLLEREDINASEDGILKCLRFGKEDVLRFSKEA